MAKVSLREIKTALSLIGDGVLMEPRDRSHYDAAIALKVAVRHAGSFKAVRGEGTAAAVCFEQLGDYETANFINATLTEAF